MKLVLILFLFFLRFFLPSHTEIFTSQIQNAMKNGINYLKINQNKEGDFKGQWPSQLRSVYNSIYRSLNIQNWRQDWNISSSLLIGNSLIEIKKLTNQFDGDFAYLQNALIQATKNYKFKDGYCFWKCNKLKDQEKCIVQDNPMAGGKGFYFACDLDNTALVFINSAMMETRKNKKAQELEKLMIKYKDPNKKGLYTWMTADKKILNQLYPVKSHGDINPIDCVVNANVLRAAMSYSIPTSSKIFEETCDYINSTFNDNSFRMCGLYYPNFIVYFYSLAILAKQNISCVKGLKEKIKEVILKEQKNDGSWWFDKFTGNSSYSTALALNILFNLESGDINQLNNRISRGIHYLLKTQQRDGSWQGESIWSEGHLGNIPTIIWRSDAVATATALEALAHFFALNLEKK